MISSARLNSDSFMCGPCLCLGAWIDQNKLPGASLKGRGIVRIKWHHRHQTSMTEAQITQRISEFPKAVDRYAKKISELGNTAWDPIKEPT